MAIKLVLFSCENSGIDICQDRNLSDSEYANAVMLLSKDPSKLQIHLNRLNDSVGMFEMHFPSTKCKMRVRSRAMLIQDKTWV